MPLFMALGEIKAVLFAMIVGPLSIAPIFIAPMTEDMDTPLFNWINNCIHSPKRLWVSLNFLDSTTSPSKQIVGFILFFLRFPDVSTYYTNASITDEVRSKSCKSCKTKGVDYPV
jgi:hypothetical protein